MKKRVFIWSLIVIILAGMPILMKIKRNKGELIKVRTAVAETGEIKAYLSTTGTVESKNKKVYYGNQGRIEKINVKVGDRVKKGDILIVFEKQDLSIQVKQAQIQYENALLQRKELINQNESIKRKMIELDKQIAELEKSSNIADKTKLESLKQQRSTISLISDEKLKQSENAVSLAKLSLEAARQNASKSSFSIISETNGVVTEINAVEGGLNSGAQPLIVVQDIENLNVVLSLGKYDMDKVIMGQEAIIKTGNNSYKGRISFIEPAAKTKISATGSETSLGIVIEVLEKSPKLTIGFDVDVDILVGRKNNIVKIPVESIKTEKGNRNLVFVVENNVAHQRTVEIGIQSDTEVEVKSGVINGEKIVLNPSTSVSDGTKVLEESGR
ncbi:macrolide ABC transporter [Fervidicella metallireducens AeB]|uniref:Macrolide ABC transporter n=1 Tax=Fervidicella metallireducens AeB TaxID=1403537 RepID=A0A017RWB7_9CLOT|nr:efflux RND transporter periplasmic adaptor subunit [Fervidicella metallireducens]EYE88694.1 macrolide ABC transporter [Fervidicella metallireducens AeB]